MIGSPLTLPCGLTLKNRVAKAAMTENMADPVDGDPNERHFRLYERWSNGGAGLLITGNVMIDRRFLEQAGNVVLDARSNFGAFQEYAKRAQAGGAKVIMQVSHPGRQSSLFITRKPVAPSASGAVKMIASFSVMNEVLASGAVDVIGLARPLAVDPDFPAKLVGDDPSIVSPVKPVRFSNKQFSAMAEAGYHGAQLERMGDGKQPDAQLSPFFATTHYLGAQMEGFVRLMRRPALPKQLLAET